MAPPINPLPAGYTPSEEDLRTAAQTLWGEARGEPTDGQVGVVWTMVNRLNLHNWMSRPIRDLNVEGGTLAAVCRQPYQYSCWLPQDANYQPMRKLPETNGSAAGLQRAEQYAKCLSIVKAVIGGSIQDPTHGATHYYADSIAAPAWARGLTPSAKIGHHLFFKGVP